MPRPIAIALLGLLTAAALPARAADPDQARETDTTDTAGADEAECRGWANVTRPANLASAELAVSSGLAASRRHPGALWIHNDSGDAGRLFLVDAAGETLAQVELADREAHDWEDVAVAPCEPGGVASCVWVGDIGDNKRIRNRVYIHRFAEPALPDERGATVTVDQVDTFAYEYADGARDAETLLVDPSDLDVYVVEKSADGQSGVYRVHGDPSGRPRIQIARRIATLDIDSPLALGRMVTGGDLAADGAEFTLRTYLSLYTFCVPAGGGVEQAFAGEPVASTPPITLQGESVGYGVGGQTLWMTSERRPAPLYRMERAER